MPNKAIRNWTHCVKVDTLSAEAENFFTRLFMCVDANGCFYASPTLLRANLFPLRIDTLTNDTIQGWLAECEQAGLLVTYAEAGVPYLHVTGYERKLKRKRDTLPTPPGFVEEPEPGKDAPVTDVLIPKADRHLYAEFIDWKTRPKPEWLYAAIGENGEFEIPVAEPEQKE